MATELSPDQKGQASLTFGEVIVQTRNNFPDPRFRPQVIHETPQYHLYGIDSHGYMTWVTADGIGTKPELAERLYHLTKDPKHFETLAFDTFAMIDGDVARFGHFLLGIAQIVDMNVATPEVVTALAKGAKNACDEGRFALLNGETAELGYRVSGYGQTRVNWNAVGKYLIAPNKLVLGTDLAPGQPLVAVREPRLRSNGLTAARSIIENSALLKKSEVTTKTDFINKALSLLDINENLSLLMGHDFNEQVLIPWHKTYPELTEELLKPSTLYGKLMYEALGGIDGEKKVDIVGAAHITGGGIPLKMQRLLEPLGLGATLDSVFPEPEGIKSLIDLVNQYDRNTGRQLINDRDASQQWNRGIGFVQAVRTMNDADEDIKIAKDLGYEAKVAGEITNKQQIEFRGHTWTY
jgi:phosphoribosylaminoimidazole (AIR) synthetase